MEPHLYTKKLAAAALSVSVRAIDNLLTGNHISYVKVGQRRLIPRSEIVRVAQYGVAANFNKGEINV
ncbi:helix-turn-helix domain-containing protein [Acidipila sp. EB88]|uniref:helix-turn-helix domain-containing protein n=1 Tax=Acidipila sp. EB88 TaxID=2305226 RepID=UPI000F5F3E29|nr:helix-turn-helix domain-containing protein [Acidipila sp. EB88]RRA49005.1 DNA-binding protein [Acidipila sp. EB88]